MILNVVFAAAGTSYAIPLAALIVSAAALIYGVTRGRVSTLSSIEQAMSDRIEDLLRQLTEAKEEMRDCARRCKRLEQRNTELMARLLKLEHTNGDDDRA